VKPTALGIRAAAALLLAAPALGHGAMHRCQDAGGQVVYTDQPCPAGTIDKSPPAPPAAQAAMPVLPRPASSAPRPPSDTMVTVGGHWPRFTAGQLSMRFEHDAVIVTNHTMQDAFYFLAPYPNSVAMVPASTPANRIAPFGAVRIALSRGVADVQGLELTWWRQGDKYPDTELHGGKDFQKLRVLRVRP
jgi:hypothetical protein